MPFRRDLKGSILPLLSLPGHGVFDVGRVAPALDDGQVIFARLGAYLLRRRRDYAQAYPFG